MPDLYSQREIPTAPPESMASPPRIWWIAHAIAAVVIGAPLMIWGISILLAGEATIYGRSGRTTTLIGGNAMMFGWGMVLSMPAAICFIFLAQFDRIKFVARGLGGVLVFAMLMLGIVAMVLHIA